MSKGIDYKIIAQNVCDTLSMLGITAQLNSEIYVDDNCRISNSVIAMVDVIGDLKFNMLYSMKIQTAESIIAIMMGASEYKMDSIGRSAIAELSNMISGGVCTGLSVEGPQLDITTPTVLTGKVVSCTIHSVESKHMEFQTQLGIIGIDFAFES